MYSMMMDLIPVLYPGMIDLSLFRVPTDALMKNWFIKSVCSAFEVVCLSI